MSNQLAGSNRMKRPSIRIHEDLLDEFDEHVKESDRWDSRNAAIVDLIEHELSREPETDGGRQPPVEDDLANAYDTLCRLTRDRGWVTEDLAAGLLAQEQSMNKKAVRRMLITPLVHRNYVQRTSDLHGNTSVRALL